MAEKSDGRIGTGAGERSEKSGGSGGLILIGLATAGILLILALKQRQQQSSSNPPAQAPPADLITLLKPHIESAVESAVKRSMHIMADGAVSAVFGGSSSGLPVSTFKNNQEQIVTRDADGFITHVKTMRDAMKVDDNAAA